MGNESEESLAVCVWVALCSFTIALALDTHETLQHTCCYGTQCHQLLT